MLMSKLILAHLFAIIDTGQPNFIHVMLRSRKFWKLGVGHFTSDSTTLIATRFKLSV